VMSNIDGCAFFRFNPSDDSLRCVHCSEGPYTFLLGRVMHPGEPVTGWVWMNRRTIRNANAKLELSHVPGFPVMPLSALSTTVQAGTEPAALGVLTGYGNADDAFSLAHSHAFEQLGKILGQRLTSTVTVDIN
jgi:hypothetical protein